VSVTQTGTITLTIDGQLISARQGESLLHVIQEQGIRLPTLCEFECLTSVGACRLCLVEITSGRPRLAAACVTAAEEGLEVKTTSERLHRYRQMTLELLLAERNHICSVCVMNNHCELQDLSAEYGVDHIRFEYLRPADLTVDASHPRYVVDHNRCILCTRCVRICDQIEGAHTWDVAKRGAAARVITDMSIPWGESVTCTSCGKCVQVCPTGALFEKGATVAEMVKHKEKLSFLNTARTQKRWELDIVLRDATNGATHPVRPTDDTLTIG
jgi:bidirectional [NiFe] hydrogenase diaphorase subunit